MILYIIYLPDQCCCRPQIVAEQFNFLMREIHASPLFRSLSDDCPIYIGQDDSSSTKFKTVGEIREAILSHKFKPYGVQTSADFTQVREHIS